MKVMPVWLVNIIAAVLLPALVIFFSLINGYSDSSDANVMRIEGTYQGQNIQVQNFSPGSDKSFCIREISVNGLHLKDFDKSNIEIDLSRFKIGQHVEINMLYKEGCRPLVLNPQVLKSKSTVYFVSVRVDKKALRWTTNNETTQEPFVIEQHRYNKWAAIGKIVGRGPEGYSNYVFPLNHFSGINKYRIKQRDIDPDWVYSETVEFFNDKKQVQFYPARVDKVIYFSERTEYEIFNKYGSLIKKGEGIEVNVSEFNPDVYYLNFDNQADKFLKK